MRNNKVRVKITPFEICNTVILLIIALLFFICVMWMGGILIGNGGLSYETYYGQYKPMIIVSESMTPTIEVNSLLFVEDKSYDDLKLDDIIVLEDEDYGLVIHRIVDSTVDGFITKGDNNEFIDNWVVTPNNYKGVVSEIHNEVSSLITFLFGNLNDLNIARVFVGFLVISVVITIVILCFRWFYLYIFVYYFLVLSSKKGGSNVLAQYYPYLSLDSKDLNFVELFDKLKTKQSVFTHLVTRYKILKLHSSLKANERMNRVLVYRYTTVRKELDKK